MATKLDKTLKREIDIDGQAYMVAISPEGVKLTQKGYRKGREMSWRALLSGAEEEGSSTGAGGGAGGDARASGGMSGQGSGGMGAQTASDMTTPVTDEMDTPTSGTVGA